VQDLRDPGDGGVASGAGVQLAPVDALLRGSPATWRERRDRELQAGRGQFQDTLGDGRSHGRQRRGAELAGSGGQLRRRRVPTHPARPQVRQQAREGGGSRRGVRRAPEPPVFRGTALAKHGKNPDAHRVNSPLIQPPINETPVLGSS